jgi:hypothetical protein
VPEHLSTFTRRLNGFLEQLYLWVTNIASIAVAHIWKGALHLPLVGEISLCNLIMGGVETLFALRLFDR